MLNKVKKSIHNLLIKKTFHVPNDLKGKVVIITGASRGIGNSIAKVLYEEGAKLTLISRNLKDLQETFKEYNNKKILLLEGDVTKEEDVKKFTDSTMKKFGKIDVLINNAGKFIGGSIEKTSKDELDSVIETNIKGIFLMSRTVVPILKKRKEGLIVNIGSKISRNTNVSPNLTLYSLTKYAVEGFSNSLHKELQPYGIRVTCLMPGTVNTYLSLKSNKYLSPYRVGQVISMLIKLDDVDFENLVIKSKYQHI